MAKPGRMKEIEQEWNEPLESLIPRLLNEHGSMPKVAQVLDISFANFYAWCQENGIEKSVTWTIRAADEKEPEHVA